MPIAYFKRPAFLPGAREVKQKETQDAVFLLPISIGQEQHFAQKGEATLALIAEKTKGPLYVLVADNLQRFNIAKKLNISIEEAEKKAIKAGDEWLEWFDMQQEKRPALKRVNVIRWGEWLKHEKYPSMLSIVEKAYEKGNGFKTAVDRAALAYVQSIIAKPEFADCEMTDLLAASINYLKEEAAITLLWIEFFINKHPGVRICQAYPQDPNPVLQYLYEKMLPEIQKAQFEYLRIHFQEVVINNNNQSEHQPASEPLSAQAAPNQNQILEQLEFIKKQMELHTQLFLTLLNNNNETTNPSINLQGLPLLFGGPQSWGSQPINSKQAASIGSNNSTSPPITDKQFKME